VKKFPSAEEIEPFLPHSERLRKLSQPLLPQDEGIVAGASNPPGFAEALADLERGFTDQATPKTIPSSLLFIFS